MCALKFEVCCSSWYVAFTPPQVPGGQGRGWGLPTAVLHSASSSVRGPLLVCVPQGLVMAQWRMPPTIGLVTQLHSWPFSFCSNKALGVNVTPTPNFSPTSPCLSLKLGALLAQGRQASSFLDFLALLS